MVLQATDSPLVAGASNSEGGVKKITVKCISSFLGDVYASMDPDDKRVAKRIVELDEVVVLSQLLALETIASNKSVLHVEPPAETVETQEVTIDQQPTQEAAGGAPDPGESSEFDEKPTADAAPAPRRKRGE